MKVQSNKKQFGHPTPLVSDILQCWVNEISIGTKLVFMQTTQKLFCPQEESHASPDDYLWNREKWNRDFSANI